MKIVYPYFLEVSAEQTDIFWKNIFENLAYGKTPTGSYIIHKNVPNVDGVVISSSFLCCQLKNKEFSWKIERKPVDQLFSELYEIFTKKLGILSEKERQQKELNFLNYEKELLQSRHNWSSINGIKNIKNVLYEKYAIDMQEKHNLSLKEVKHLVSLIHIAIVFKAITPKDIVFEDGKIRHIEGIEFEPEGKNRIKLTRPIFTGNCPTPAETRKCKKTIRMLWDKHVADLSKTIA